MFRLICKIIFLVCLLTGCTFTPGTSALPTPANARTGSVFVEPDAGLAPVLSAVNMATRSLRWHVHFLTDKDLLDALKSARGRGVDVRVMLESQPAGTSANNRATTSALQSAGVSVRSSHAAFKLTHTNFLVVDDQVAFVLTFDATRAGWTEARGFGVRVTQPELIAELAVVFESDWKRAPVAPVQADLAWSPVNARQRLAALFDGAQRSLDLECDELSDAILQARLLGAMQRGVTVRLLTSPTSNDAAPDWLKPLTRPGLNVRLVKTPDMHGTLVLADNARAFVGATRLTTAALDTHRDLGVLLEDAGAIQTLVATFASDWNIGK